MKAKTLFLLALITSANLFAQKNFQWALHIAPSLGEFGEGSEDDFNGHTNDDLPYSYTGVGLGTSIEYHLPISQNLPLFILGKVGIYRTGIRSALRKAYRQTYYTEEGEQIKYPFYYNVPITLGLHYEKNFESGIGIFAQGGVLVDFLKVSKTKRDYKYGINIHTHEIRYNLSRAFGLSVGGGILINERYSLGLSFLSLGTHTFNENNTWIKPGSLNTGTELLQKPVSMANISFGILF